MLQAGRAFQVVARSSRPAQAARGGMRQRPPPLPNTPSTSQQRWVTQATATGTPAAMQISNGAPQQGIVFTSFTVYKSKGALAVKPVRPRFTSTANGNYTLDREGSFMFELAPALGERKYNWDSKVQLAMSPLELATIVSDPTEEHTFYHDTFKGNAALAGTMFKQLKWSPAPDGKAYFLSATSTEKDPSTKQEKSRKTASVSITSAEFYALQKLVDFCMPYMYGFDAAFTVTPGSPPP